jgi:hypothetical protein
MPLYNSYKPAGEDKDQGRDYSVTLRKRSMQITLTPINRLTAQDNECSTTQIPCKHMLDQWDEYHRPLICA